MTLAWIFFQEFEEALKKLRKAYFSNKPTVDAIKRTNSDLLSDARFNYATIRSAVLQANANHRGTTDTERKNTFLFRWKMEEYDHLVQLTNSRSVYLQVQCYYRFEFDEHNSQKEIEWCCSFGRYMLLVPVSYSFFHWKKKMLLKLHCFSCHYLDEIKLHDKHLEQKDLNYELIMRFVKMITNFARNG